MANAAGIQALLRFLSQDAKVPLPTAMSKVKELIEAGHTRLGPPMNCSTRSRKLTCPVLPPYLNPIYRP
jgi:hypothetical protein